MAFPAQYKAAAYLGKHASHECLGDMLQSMGTHNDVDGPITQRQHTAVCYRKAGIRCCLARPKCVGVDVYPQHRPAFVCLSDSVCESSSSAAHLDDAQVLSACSLREIMHPPYEERVCLAHEPVVVHPDCVSGIPLVVDAMSCHLSVLPGQHNVEHRLTGRTCLKPRVLSHSS
jgi:hypothetical protein